MLNNKGSKTDPCGTPKINSSHDYSDNRFLRQAKVKLTADFSNPYAFNFATNNSCERLSKACERSVNKTPNIKLWSKHCFHFSISLIIQ